jgi:hypothetical protein
MCDESSHGPEVGPWDLAAEVTRTIIRGTRRHSPKWVIGWLVVAIALTVILAVTHAAWCLGVMPLLVLVVAFSGPAWGSRAR